ncbi:MAG: dTMP kinase [Planctomycetota bacterium]|jgi:dTMP kinase|nr:dTMP kinase [Planctomycetota bacterium]
MTLIVFEGIDGCGKSTQLERAEAWLREAGHDPLVLREPGGTSLGENIRTILLDPATEACPIAELLAYQVARAQLVHEQLMPARAAGRTVLLDRFWYSTIAYQAYGLGLDAHRVRSAIDLAIDGLHADLALYLRIDPTIAEARRTAAGADRIEARGLEYLERVRDGYEALVASGDLTAIDAELGPDQVFEAVTASMRSVI